MHGPTVHSERGYIYTFTTSLTTLRHNFFWLQSIVFIVIIIVVAVIVIIIVCVIIDFFLVAFGTPTVRFI